MPQPVNLTFASESARTPNSLLHKVCSRRLTSAQVKLCISPTAREKIGGRGWQTHYVLAKPRVLSVLPHKIRGTCRKRTGVLLISQKKAPKQEGCPLQKRHSPEAASNSPRPARQTGFERQPRDNTRTQYLGLTVQFGPKRKTQFYFCTPMPASVQHHKP